MHLEVVPGFENLVTIGGKARGNGAGLLGGVLS
jgi:hypothetical protein